MLSTEEKKALIRYARACIGARLGGAPAERPASSPSLGMPGGAFVTLKKDGDLRGCIGRMASPDPLLSTVAAMAPAAAFEDPRFPPVTAEELPSIKLEISVLTPLRKISDPKEVEVGTHGIYLSNGYRSGVLLPQVPVEWGWDRATFLRQGCRKAGMPESALQDPYTELFVFEAEVFSESD